MRFLYVLGKSYYTSNYQQQWMMMVGKSLSFGNCLPTVSGHGTDPLHMFHYVPIIVDVARNRKLATSCCVCSCGHNHVIHPKLLIGFIAVGTAVWIAVTGESSIVAVLEPNSKVSFLLLVVRPGAPSRC